MKRAQPLILRVAAKMRHVKQGLSPTLVAADRVKQVRLDLSPILAVADWANHMKRALSLILIIAACVAGFLSIRGEMPFIPVFGTSMEPVLHAGNLILIEKVLPADVEVGDIIVFEVTPMIREGYNYPPVIAHRVKEIFDREDGIVFRTKGDNTGEDPFAVRPQDLMGKVSHQIPYLGFPLLFFQSQQGLIFVIVALSLFSIYLYMDELAQGRKKIQKVIFAPIVQESRRNSRLMEQTMNATEKRMERTEQVLEKFASAIEVYAQHLQSHTSAIQGLSEASQELKKGAAEQNKVLARLLGAVEQTELKKEKVVSGEEETAPEKEEIEPKVAGPFPPGCTRSRRKITE